MNRIPEIQNSRQQLQRLAAQRQIYAKAKRLFGWQVVVSGPVAVLLAFITILIPSLKPFAALWGIIAALCDIAWLTPWQKRLRAAAAGVQEAFDCDVLSLPWDDFKTGRRPDPELVAEYSSQYEKSAASMPALTDWYSVEVGVLPIHVARLICQRSNCWWDAKQRRRYASVVLFAVVLVFVSVLLLSMGGEFSIDTFILNVVAPLSPTLLLGCRQFGEQMEAAARLDKLKEYAENLWRETLGGLSEGDATMRARTLQSEIFENRRKGPLVFDALFKRLRNAYEVQMNHAAAEYVAEAKSVF
jgi:hypothetical protein